MATVSLTNQIPCDSFTFCSRILKSSSSATPSIFLPSSPINRKPQVLPLRNFSVSRPAFKVRAADEFQWGSDSETPQEGTAEGLVGAVLDEPSREIEKLKRAVVDSFYGTDRGLNASSETRAEIVELITQLEAKNPTPAPTEALTLLNGKWILTYTSSAGLYPLLSRGTLPLMKVEQISQTIDSENLTVQNSVRFAGPLSTTSITTNATFEVHSPKRVQIKIVEGIIGTPQLTDSIVIPDSVEFLGQKIITGTPQLTDSIVIPDSVEFLGQKIDLAPFKSILTSFEDTASSVAKTISDQPPLKFSLSSSEAESWLLTTYLDEDLRISRGDGGSVFVLLKEGSPLLIA